MPIDRDILSRVKQLAAKKCDEMTADHLFTSYQFLSYAQSVVNTLTRQSKVNIRLRAFHGNPDGITAYTDNREIVVNTHHMRVYHFDSLVNKFLSQMGGIFHECAHIIYMNFDVFEEQMKAIQDGAFLDLPVMETQEDQDTLEAVSEALKDAQYRPMLADVYRSIYNSLQDGHDEDRIMANSVPFVSQCILMRREAKRTEFPAAEEMIAKRESSELHVMYALILQTALFDEVFLEDPRNALKLEPVQKLRDMIPLLQEGKYTDDAHLRGEKTLRIMTLLWPYIQKELEERRNKGESENQAIQQVIAQLGQCAGQGATVVPRNTKTSAVAKALQNAAGRNPEGGQAFFLEHGQEEEQGQNALNSLISQIATEEAEKETQQEITDEAGKEIPKISMNSTHRGIKVCFIPQTQVTAEDIQNYDAMFAGLENFSRRLQKQMGIALRDLSDGGILHHRSFGNCLETKAVYRPDQRYFALKRQPVELPQMAISILADHSGSMSGERIEAVMKAAMLLYDFATKLGIPVEVAGHNTLDSCRGINYFLYTDFRQVSPNEKFRLAKMVSTNCNRDGAAIEIAANRLSRRPEDIKLLFILSDGQPCDDGYGGEAAEEDIRGIVRRYQKLKVETIAAAIGYDKENIKRIYGAGAFLDIDDLSRLPKALANIVRKRLLA